MDEWKRWGHLERLKHVGFWKTPYENSAGMSLPNPQDFVDDTWDREERRIVIEYLKGPHKETGCMGYSWCRMCDVRGQEMGNSDIDDGEYVWPEGYLHYIEKHGVRPPVGFVRHVLAKAKTKAET